MISGWPASSPSVTDVRPASGCVPATKAMIGVTRTTRDRNPGGVESQRTIARSSVPSVSWFMASLPKVVLLSASSIPGWSWRTCWASALISGCDEGPAKPIATFPTAPSPA